MTEPLTIVFGFRDRDIERVGRCLRSLSAQTEQSFKVTFVDYGSTQYTADRVRQLTADFGFCDYVYSDTRGRPWNRSQALNIGGRLADTPATMTTDVDMIFAPHFVERLLALLEKDRVLCCLPYRLPRRFREWDRLASFSGGLPRSDESALGSCQCFDTSVFQEMRGFDEFYRYWGREDRDLSERLEARGIRIKWITEQVNMFHQWHPVSNFRTPGFMPDGVWGRMQAHFLQHRDEVVRNDNRWGRIICAEDRPVLQFLDIANGALVSDERLSILSLDPNDNASVGEFLTRFWQLPSGSALALNHAFWGLRTLGGQSRPVRMANKLFARMNIGIQIGPTRNLLHNYLAEFIDAFPEMIADYFLGFPTMNGVSVLVRA